MSLRKAISIFVCLRIIIIYGFFQIRLIVFFLCCQASEFDILFNKQVIANCNNNNLIQTKFVHGFKSAALSKGNLFKISNMRMVIIASKGVAIKAIQIIYLKCLFGDLIYMMCVNSTD